MFERIIGAAAPSSDLKAGLDRSARELRRIAHRVANAGRTEDGGFADVLEEAGEADADPVDLEAEMVALADEQIRYEVSTRLLRKVYQQARQSVREG